MSRRLLATYLNDHYAASVGAVELSRRVAGANRDTTYGPALAELSVEIEQDRRTLASIMERLGIRCDPVKPALAWSAEKLGRLKLNGQLTGYSPLSRLEELEILELGVTGKLLLWESLERTEVAPEEIEQLIERARAQRERLETLRREATAEALT